MKDVEKLSKSIGERPAGSEAGVSAVEYIADQFSAARFGVLRTNFTFETNPNRPATITVGGATIDAITAGGSKDGAVTGAAAPLPIGVVAGGLTGKVAVTVRGGASFQEKYDTAWASGAVALVIVNSDSGTVTANLGETAAFPVVTVAGAAQAQVEAAAANGSPLTVTVSAPETDTGTNITARSRSAHACTYIVVANFDSVPNSPGANDNASGVAVMLELARQFDQISPLPDICFIALDARFSGGQGVRRYLEALTATGRPASVISISKVGAGGDLTMYGELTLKNKLSGFAKSLGVSLNDGGLTPPAATDGDEFRAAGISTVEVSRVGGQVGREDTFDRIDSGKLAQAGRLVGQIAVTIGATTGP